MLTGPIFSQEEEEEMMNLSEFRERQPRVNESQEYSRGTVILEGEDEVVDDVVGGNDRLSTPPNVIPNDCGREEYSFSLDFSAPTHVYSLQFTPPNDEQNLHEFDGEHEDRRIAGYLKLNMLFCWVVIFVVAVLYGVQQLVLVKNDLAALRLENEQLRLTVETLQQEHESNKDEDYFYKLFEAKFPAEATNKLNECATEAKNQIYHHITDLKDSFWMTAEHVRDIIEEEIIGPATKETEITSEDGAFYLEQWLDKKGLKQTLNKTVKQVQTAAKVVVPVLLVSGATMAVDWFWKRDD
ncbi:hypothetical protein MPSEU_000652500 [Mayamaea pseudoterrestris]|nr:hypothetical protein MPSEU_000652500 [Mayamaea pseudoterrestris]